VSGIGPTIARLANRRWLGEWVHYSGKRRFNQTNDTLMTDECVASGHQHGNKRPCIFQTDEALMRIWSVLHQSDEAWPAADVASQRL
jgi:hypothetical protein